MKPMTSDAAGGGDDELARAEVYGLLAELFQAAPSPALYAQLQVPSLR